MEILNIISGYLPYAVVLLVLAGGAAAAFLNQRRSVKEWLLLAVTEAEKALGSGTGQLKLRLVYQAFIQNFGFFARLVRFETFALWVNESLVEMRKYLEGAVKSDEAETEDEDGDIH